MDCTVVWRKYNYVKTPTLKQVIKSCYECGSWEHFGDDCEEVRRTGWKISAFYTKSTNDSPKTTTISSAYKTPIKDNNFGVSGAWKKSGGNGNNSVRNQKSGNHPVYKPSYQGGYSKR
jgi:hypothetical protein